MLDYILLILGFMLTFLFVCFVFVVVLSIASASLVLSALIIEKACNRYKYRIDNNHIDILYCKSLFAAFVFKTSINSQNERQGILTEPNIVRLTERESKQFTALSKRQPVDSFEEHVKELMI